MVREPTTKSDLATKLHEQHVAAPLAEQPAFEVNPGADEFMVKLGIVGHFAPGSFLSIAVVALLDACGESGEVKRRTLMRAVSAIRSEIAKTDKQSAATAVAMVLSLGAFLPVMAKCVGFWS